MSNIQAFRAALQQLVVTSRNRVGPRVQAEVDALADAIRAKAPKGKTGNLARSVQVLRTNSPNRFRVVAGGDLTTKEIRAGSGVKYEREVKIGSGDTAGIAKRSGGKGVTYDYARATEFGTVNEVAEPFFYITYRKLKSRIKKNIVSGIASDITG